MQRVEVCYFYLQSEATAAFSRFRALTGSDENLAEVNSVEDILLTLIYVRKHLEKQLGKKGRLLRIVAEAAPQFRTLIGIIADGAKYHPGGRGMLQRLMNEVLTPIEAAVSKCAQQVELIAENKCTIMGCTWIESPDESWKAHFFDKARHFPYPQLRRQVKDALYLLQDFETSVPKENIEEEGDAGELTEGNSELNDEYLIQSSNYKKRRLVISAVLIERAAVDDDTAEESLLKEQDIEKEESFDA
jgi:hypothetical protein